MFKNLSFGIFKNDKIGVIGPNGSGKSTFFKILAGITLPDTGTVSHKRSLRIAYVPQESSLPNESLKSTLMKSLSKDSSLNEFEKNTRIEIALGKFGFKNLSQKVETLSGGWKKRLEIAKEIITLPELLLLDEPTNHLDLEGVLWLEDFLKKGNFSYMAISHDRTFLQNISNRTLEINKKYPDGIFSIRGNYCSFLEKREDFLQEQMQHKKSLQSKVKREIEWLKQNPKARTTKSQSRIRESQYLIKELHKAKLKNEEKKAEIDFSSTKRKSKKLLKVKNISKSIGEKQLFSEINFTLSPGSRLGIVGKNGSGKSSLMKILYGEEKPEGGNIEYAQGIRIVYFDQHKEELPSLLSIQDALTLKNETVYYRGKHIHATNWCKRFLFSPNRLSLPIAQASGGEKARILIARLMLQPADILLLDEPSNDLDIPTLEILEESLLDFPGALVLISHDRYLLDRVSNSILALGCSREKYIFSDYRQWLDFQDVHSLPSPHRKKNDAIKIRKEKKQSKKLSYKEKLEWEKMEADILNVEGEIYFLEEKIKKNSLSSKELQEICKSLKNKQDRLDRLYIRWQELEEKQL